MSAAGLTLFVGFGLVMATCASSLSDAFKGLGDIAVPEQVQPIPIPKRSCPYLRLVSAAATDAGAPWHDALQDPPPAWKPFAGKLSSPLEALDNALAAAGPNVPEQVARDLRTVRHDVQVGRVELLSATSVGDYMVSSHVVEGYSALGHASGLVGNACGFTLAPPLPF